MSVFQCDGCQAINSLVDDYQKGCTLCRECGLVVCGTLIDEEAEWRTFEDGSQEESVRASADLGSQYGLPDHMQLTTMDHSGTDYHSSIREMERLCHVLQLHPRVMSVAQELWGLYRSCVKSIHDLTAVQTYIVYHASYLAGSPLFMRTFLKATVVESYHVRRAGRTLCRLIDGRVDNSPSAAITFSTPGVRHANGRWQYPHLTGHSLQHRTRLLLQRIVGHYQLWKEQSRMEAVLQEYIKHFPHSQRSVDTLATGVFYRVVQYLQLPHVRLTDLSRYTGVSESSISDMMHDLPQLHFM